MTISHLLTVRQHIRERFGPEAERQFLADLSPYERDWLRRQESAAIEDDLPSTLLFDRPWLTHEVDAPVSLPEVGEGVRRGPIPYDACAQCRTPLNGPAYARFFMAGVCSQECASALMAQTSESLVAVSTALLEVVAPVVASIQEFVQTMSVIMLAGDDATVAPPISRRRARRPIPPRTLRPTRFAHR